ncbi:synaptic vesicle 2-related protein-like [Dendronephthya gigantea]|uniref:synaptic vesicle 2-related protein-like n=1 Tax=Dendronephthya gigantea TaxID=151771 RepID=UPI00106B1998|nr:synaptic vesicle 2-related protein-like [Dendronephthya gigantea]
MGRLSSKLKPTRPPSTARNSDGLKPKQCIKVGQRSEGLKAKQSTKIEVKYQHIADVDEKSVNSKDDLFKSRQIDEILDDIGLRLLHWKVFVFLCLLVMTSAFATCILSAILPALKPDWNISEVMAGILTLSTSTGKIVGATFWGWVSDKIGRKRSFIGSTTFMFVFSLSSAFATNYYWLWISLFFAGFGATISIQGYVMIVELFPKRYQSMFSVLTMVFWTAGFLLSAVVSMELSLIGYHWALATVCFPTAIVLFCSIFFIPDTPYFYLVTGDEQKALNILQDLAPEMDFSDTVLRKHNPETQRADFTQLFRSGYWKITICACIAFFNIYISHNDLIYTASDVAGSQNYLSTTATGLQNEESRYLYSIMVWMNLPEAVLIVVTALFSYVFTVKSVLLAAMFLTLVSQIIALFVVNQRLTLLVVTMMSRSLLLSDITLLIVFMSLVYPAENRSIGTGTCVTIGRIGIIVGPFIFETWFAKKYFYGTVFNVAIIFVSFIATILLPTHA